MPAFVHSCHNIFLFLVTETDDQINFDDNWWPCLSELHGQWIWASRGEDTGPYMSNKCIHMTNDCLMFQRVEFPMPSNNFSFSLANRRWDLLANEGLHRNLFTFDKVPTNNNLLPSCYPDMLHLVVFWLCNCSGCCCLLKVV